MSFPSQIISFTSTQQALNKFGVINIIPKPFETIIMLLATPLQKIFTLSPCTWSRSLAFILSFPSGLEASNVFIGSSLLAASAVLHVLRGRNHEHSSQIGAAGPKGLPPTQGVVHNPCEEEVSTRLPNVSRGNE